MNETRETNEQQVVAGLELYAIDLEGDVSDYDRASVLEPAIALLRQLISERDALKAELDEIREWWPAIEASVWRDESMNAVGIAGGSAIVGIVKRITQILDAAMSS
jgi:hypothetical protein